MGVLTIGPGAVDRSTAAGYVSWTRVLLDGPADGTGTVTAFEIWANQNLSNCKVGTFYGSSTSYTSRDYETVGSVTAGSKQTFSGLDCDAESGDFIGAYFDTAGSLEAETSGFAGVYIKSGDQFGAGTQTYSLRSGDVESFYGTGETVAAGWTGIVMGVTNPGKIYGIEVANIASVMGVS